MIYALHGVIALVSFLIRLNGFLKDSNTHRAGVILDVILLCVLVALFVVFGWKAGLAGLVMTFVYWWASRPLAARAARKLFSGAGGNPVHIPYPPQNLARISATLGDVSTESLVQSLLGDDSRDRALEALLDLCESDPVTKPIVREFGATRATLRDLYDVLCRYGAGQWCIGHFVPASAMVYPETLRYLLQCQSDGKITVQRAMNVVRYFEQGESLAA